LCKANRIDARTEARWIQDGEQLTDTQDESGKVVRKGIASQILDVLEERGRHQPATAAALGLSRKETQDYSIFKAIRVLKFGARNQRVMEDAAFEIECSHAVAKKLGRELTSSLLVPAEVLLRPLGAEAVARAMATTPGSKGGYMVNVQKYGLHRHPA
jgi:hypothetical protein